MDLYSVKMVSPFCIGLYKILKEDSSQQIIIPVYMAFLVINTALCYGDTHTQILIHTQILTHTHIYIYMYTHTYIYMYTHTHIYIYIYIYIHIYMNQSINEPINSTKKSHDYVAKSSN